MVAPEMVSTPLMEASTPGNWLAKAASVTLVPRPGVSSWERVAVLTILKNVLCLNVTGEIYSPSGVTAVVVAEVLTIEINVCGRVCAFNLKVVFSACGELRGEEALGIVASASVIVVAAILTVGSIPAVGKIYLLTNRKLCKISGNVFGEDPIWIHAANCSHFV